MAIIDLGPCECCGNFDVCGSFPTGYFVSFTVSGAKDYTLIKNGEINDPCPTAFQSTADWLDEYGVGVGSPVTLGSKYFASAVNGVYIFRKDSAFTFTPISYPSAVAQAPSFQRVFGGAAFRFQFLTYAVLTASLDIMAGGDDPLEGAEGRSGSVLSLSVNRFMGANLCYFSSAVPPIVMTGCYQGDLNQFCAVLGVGPPKTDECDSFATYDPSIIERDTFTASIEVEVTPTANPLP